MNEPMPWCPFYFGDWLTSSRVRCLGAFARGIYIDLLAFQWREGSVPSDPSRVARMIGLTDDETTLLEEQWPSIKDAFEELGGGEMLNPRLEVERAKSIRKHQAAVESGRKGGSSKAKGSLEAPSSNHSHSHIQSQNTSPSERKPRAPRTGPQAELIRHFEETWMETRMTPYAIQAKDAVSASKALKLAGGDLALAKDRVDAMLRHSDDAWVMQHASLPLLVSQWNQFAVKVVPRPKNALQGLLNGLEQAGWNQEGAQPRLGA